MPVYNSVVTNCPAMTVVMLCPVMPAYKPVAIHCPVMSYSEPLFKKLNVLKIDGMLKLQLLTFCFDLINNNLPAYFINMSSLLQPVIYHHNIRQKRNYSVARVKRVFAQKCMRFCIPDILNKSSSLITDKIKNS